MFAFLLFNTRKFFLETVETFSWSDDCKSQFLQNLRESLCWAPLGFYFPVQLYSRLLGRKNKGKDLTLLQLSLLTATVHLLDQHCSGSQIMPTLRLLPELEDETSSKLYLFFDVLQHSPCHRCSFVLLLWWVFIIYWGFVWLDKVVASQVLVEILFLSITHVSWGNRLEKLHLGDQAFQISVTNAVWALIKGCSGYRLSIVIHNYI